MSKIHIGLNMTKIVVCFREVNIKHLGSSVTSKVIFKSDLEGSLNFLMCHL